MVNKDVRVSSRNHREAATPQPFKGSTHESTPDGPVLTRKINLTRQDALLMTDNDNLKDTF